MLEVDGKPSSIMLKSLYFIMTALTTVGFGDIIPRTLSEAVLTIFIMASAVALFSFSLKTAFVIRAKLIQGEKESSLNE